MISKELLSLVLSKEVKEINAINKDEKFEDILWYNDYSDGLNLDTLGRLCKEWCLKQDYEINSRFQHPMIAINLYMYGYEVKANSFIEKTELEAIMKATEWVAKERDLL